MMKSFVKLALISGVLSFADTAFAEPLCRSSLRTLFAEVAAVRMPIKFAGFDSREVEDMTETISFVEVAGFVKPDGALRWTAFADRTHRRVYLNTLQFHRAEILPLLCLHEVLLILGADDRQYQISLAIDASLRLARSSKEVWEEPAFRALAIFLAEPRPLPVDPSWEPDAELLAGGGDMVGNGGDDLGLAFKRALIIHTVSREIGSPRWALGGWHMLLSLPLEVSYEEGGIRYEGVAPLRPMGRRIVVPRALALASLRQPWPDSSTLDELYLFWSRSVARSAVGGMP